MQLACSEVEHAACLLKEGIIMKRTVALIFIVLIFSPATVIAADITKEDLQRLETVMKAEMKIIQSSLQSEVRDVRSEIKDVRSEINNVRSEIKDVRADIKSVEASVKAVQSDVNAIKWLVELLVVIVAAIAVLPQILAFLKERKETKRVDELSEKVEAIQKAFDAAFSSAAPGETGSN